MARKESVPIAARLKMDVPEERAALEVFTRLKDQGYTPLQIITDALNRLGNNAPEMFHTEDDPTIISIINELRNDMVRMLSEIKRADPVRLREYANSEEDELDEEFTQTLLAIRTEPFKGK